MERDTHVSDSLIHAGAGTTLVLTYLALIPGFLPFLALTALVTAVLVVPLLVIGLAFAVVVVPPYGVWRLATGGRRRQRREHPNQASSGISRSPSRRKSAARAVASMHVS